MTKDATFLGADTYGDAALAGFYDSLDFSGTYQLAVRDLPDIIARQVQGDLALDFGCGSGRSTRFLKSLGFNVTGVDVSQAMLDNAQRRDPEGEYVLVEDGDLSRLNGRIFDLILSAFPLASTPSHVEMQALLRELRDVMAPEGRLIVIEPTDFLYLNEWMSFSTSAFPENSTAKSGDPVSVSFRDRMDEPVIDVLWTDQDYRQNFKAVGFRLLETYRPLAREDEPGAWISEREIPPWVIYVLSASPADASGSTAG